MAFVKGQPHPGRRIGRGALQLVQQLRVAQRLLGTEAGPVGDREAPDEEMRLEVAGEAEGHAQAYPDGL